jgi:hypothetical protein
VIGIAVTFHLNSQRPPDLLALRAWEHAIIWLWPGGIVMMVEPKNRVIEALGLVWSVLVNGCLYSMVGLAAGALWQRLGRARDRSR